METTASPLLPLLQLKGATIRFGGLTAVSDLDLEIGGHELIKDGAKLVQTVEDVLDEFPDLARVHARARAHTHARTRARARADSAPQDPELSAVWELLDWVEPRHHDDLAVMMNLDIKEVNRRLTLLEIGGYIIGDCGAVTRRAQN